MAFLSDATLVASDGKEYKVSKATLASCSGFFLRTFKKLPDESQFTVDESAEWLKLALSHMYDNCDTLPITLDNVRGLVAFFAKYEVPKGISACDAFLSISVVLDMENLPDWIVLGDQHTMPFFLEKCVNYASEHHLAEKSMAEEWMVQLLPATLSKLVSRTQPNE